MASIEFKLDGTPQGRRDLAAFLHNESISIPAGADEKSLAIKFDDVPEDLAVWLLSSVAPLHGLKPVLASVPSAAHKAVEDKDEPVPAPVPAPAKPAPKAAPAKAKAEDK